MDTGMNESTLREKDIPKKVKAKVKTIDQPSIVMLKAAIRFLSTQLGSGAQHEAFKQAFPDLFE